MLVILVWSVWVGGMPPVPRWSDVLDPSWLHDLLSRDEGKALCAEGRDDSREGLVGGRLPANMEPDDATGTSALAAVRHDFVRRGPQRVTRVAAPEQEDAIPGRGHVGED